MESLEKREGVKHFNWLCSLLPEDFNWSDPLTPDVAEHIALASRRSAGATGQEPVAWVCEKAETLVFGGWDKRPFSKHYRPVFYGASIGDNEARDTMLTALQEVLATPGLQSGLQAMCAAAIARTTGRDVADVIKGV